MQEGVSDLGLVFQVQNFSCFGYISEQLVAVYRCWKAHTSDRLGTAVIIVTEKALISKDNNLAMLSLYTAVSSS